MADDVVGGQLARRALLKGAAASAAGAVVAPTFWRQAMAAGAPPAAAPHLAFGADPASMMTVSWSTARSVSGALLEVGPTPALGLAVPVQTVGYHLTPTRYHHARVTGLAPDTTYHWRISHAAARLARARSIPAPRPASRCGSSHSATWV